MSFTTRARALGFVVCAALSALSALGPTYACAQEDPTERARRILDESQAHHEAGRDALAAEGYLQVYEVLREIGRAAAPIALWNAGNALADVPGRERDAITTLRRFLDESTVLTDDPQVVGWRSTAVGLIAELEARQGGDAQALDRPSSQPSTASEQADELATDQHDGDGGGGSVSPVGPVILGVGAAALLAAVVAGPVSFIQGNDFADACGEDLSACSPDLRPQYDEMRTLSAVADALLVAGVAVAALGLVLTLTLTDDEEGASASVTATCGANQCAALAWGRF